MNYCKKLVFTVKNVIGNIKFSGIMCAFAVTNELAVNIKVNAGDNAKKRKNELFTAYLCIKKLSVNCNRLFIGNVRWSIIKRIGAVDISRTVIADSLPSMMILFVLPILR